MIQFVKNNKFAFFLLTFSLLLIWTGYFLNEPLNQFYNTNNHIFIHTVLELTSVIICFVIGLYGWKAYDETGSKTFLILPFLFLSIGTLDLFHLMTFPGMPFFISESSIEKTAWFWVLARGTTAVGILYLIYLGERKAEILNKKALGLYTCFYLLLCIGVIYAYEKQLPILIVSNQGPTTLKNILEYIISGLLLLSLVKTYSIYKHSKRISDLELVFGLCLLLLSELTLTIYNNISDIFVVVGHIIKVFGYTFILKAYFFSRLQLNFQKKLKTEKDLKNTQELLQAFFNHTPDSITIMDQDGRILEINDGFERVYGWKEEEVKGKLFREIMPDLRENIDYVVNEVSSGKKMIAYNTTRQRKDGTNIIINMTISPIKDDQGKVIQMAAISRDITLQKQAENKILEMERELKDTLRKQQGVIFKFRKVEDEFIHTICEGELLNDLQIQPEQIVGKPLYEHPIKGVSESLRIYYEQSWRGQDVTFEIPISERICVITLKPIKLEQEVIEVIGSCIDITQLKRTEELLQKSEKLAVVGELAAGLAHEIRNPLTTLKGFTQLIESQQGQANRSYIELMLSELDRIELITNEFMAVAKPQAIKFQEHDLLQIVHQIIVFSTPQALLKNIEFIERYETENNKIICDGNQIKQVFINLIKNAIEAMPSGGKLYISVLEKADHLKIEIRDTGVGVPKEILPKLGEPFYTLKEKGTGLGLMVSYRIIESHRGTIKFESEEQVGTTVTVTLPLKK